mmetsp:Transcript_44716/g.107901  ORF Transcript_44716/g.107901 Transcript_44716/m.107901 type:complete len:376 (-) Transcript_44716:159-1286(-)
MSMADLDFNDSIITPGVVLQLEEHDNLITQQQQQQQQIVRYQASDIQRLQTLGKGAFCSVSLVISRSQNKDLAMKHLDIKKIKSPAELLIAATDLVMEAHCLSKLSHQNIIKLRGVSQTPFAQSFEQDEHGFFLLMDVMGETLQDRLRKWRNDPLCFEKRSEIRSKLSRKAKKLNLQSMYGRLETVAIGIAKAMEYMHQHNIVHRDLKPANAGFNKATGEVCIFDFGLARELPSCSNDEICGTPRYLAPEVLRGEGYSFNSDVYSFGVLLHEVVSLHQPKRPKNVSVQSQNDMRSTCSSLTRPSLDDIPCRIVSYLIQDCWSDNPESRPSFEVVCMSLQSLMPTLKQKAAPDSWEKEHAESSSTLNTVPELHVDD